MWRSTSGRRGQVAATPARAGQARAQPRDVGPAAGAASEGRARGARRRRLRWCAAGPEVLPGKYTIALKAPGSGPRVGWRDHRRRRSAQPFSDADRRTRQSSLLALYDLEKALGGARSSARALTAQLAAIKRDLAPAAGGRRGAPGGESRRLWRQVAARPSQVQGDIERQLNGASQLARAIEGYSACRQRISGARSTGPTRMRPPRSRR